MNKRSLAAAAGLAPALLVIVLLFAGGLALAAINSFGFFAPTGESAFTLRHYAAVVSEREFQQSLGLSIVLATLATLLSAITGLWLAITLRATATRSGTLSILLQLPIAIPHLAVAVALIHFVSPSGLIARLAYSAGAIAAPQDFPALIADRFGAGILIAYVLKESPFVAMMTLALLARSGTELESAARTLGASRWQALRYVTLPLVTPAALSASLIVFAFTFGAFDVPFLLGRPFPSMLGVVAQRRYMGADLADRPEAIAIAVLMTLITGFLAWAYLRLAHAASGVERPVIF